ncbi:MAG: hypothetical protein CMB71_03655 [Euryarchaeota archaeon]|nr:hypothetical protein [Euryarchaeota archaeon]|tara:strand:- start:1245 stop:1781 length:537 start_codon:yes stop_codon:yes gene_type:complete
MAGDQAESDGSTDVPEEFQPKSPAMKRWKKRYIDHDDVDDSTTEEDDESNSNEVVQPLVSDANLQFRGFCQLLIAVAIIGAIFSFIGYATGPQTCDDDNLFEILGQFMFWTGLLGIPINLFILLISFANSEFDSKDVFVWTLIHFVVSMVFLFLFVEYLLQDMFCDACMGYPGEDCSD